MAIEGEALDVILSIIGLRSFQTGMREAAVSTRQVGAAATQSSAASTAAMTKTMTTMALVRKMAFGVTAAIVGIGIEGYRLTNEFDKQMNQVSVVTGESLKQLEGVRHSILNMAGDVGFGPAKLAEAMAHIAKIDLPGVDRLKLLKDAADGASVGLADVVETTDTLAGAIKVHMPGLANDTRVAMGQLISAAQTGNMSLSDFNLAMGTGILPTAKNYGLTLTDITGALSIFTDEHMQGSSAMAQLATSFHFLTGATKTGEDALKRIGLSGLTLAQEMRGPRGLQTALADLKSHLDAFSSDPSKQTMMLDKILPGGRGRILRVLMNQLDNYGAKMDQQAKQTNNFDENVAKTHETATWRLHAAWAGLQSELINVADAYKGPLTSALVGIMGGITAFVGFVADHKTTTEIFVGLILGLAAAFVTYKFAVWGAAAATALWEGAMTAVAFVTLIAEVGSLADAFVLLSLAMDANPIGIIAIAIVALIAFLVVLYHKWNWFHNAVDNTVNFVKHHKDLLLLLLGPLGPILFLIVHLKDVLRILKSIVHWAEHAAGSVAKAIVNAVPGGGLLNDLAGAVGLPHVEMGKSATPSVSAAGSRTTYKGPKTTGNALGAALALPDQHHHIKVVLPDGKVLAQTVNKENANRKARK